MNIEDAEHARLWLATQGVTQVGDGVWAERGAPGTALTPNEVAHAWTSAALDDPDLDGAARLRLAFGLLDVLDEYWVTAELGFALKDEEEQDPLPAEAFWDGYRQRLEAAEEPEAVTYSLWVDWFEDRATAEVAFAEVLGNDFADLSARPLLSEAAEGPLFRRARRVLAASGPVPWPVKHSAYRTAAAVPALHTALFQGILHSYRDFYGDLEPRAALALLRRLDLPPGTEHLSALCAVLEAGHTHHRLAPEAWQSGPGPGPGPVQRLMQGVRRMIMPGTR
ncbi:hypothetical protein WKI65_40625 [Streptomyces sp. MS1.AVA.3]|uniref:hypothetical protein n=1 Tax=Streptomyces decoyicus TaxID=249567 RepID=UPI0030C0C383